MSAARHAVFVEGVAKLLDQYEEIVAIKVDLKHPDMALIRAKTEAAKAIPDLRAALYPDD